MTLEQALNLDTMEALKSASSLKGAQYQKVLFETILNNLALEYFDSRTDENRKSEILVEFENTNKKLEAHLNLFDFLFDKELYLAKSQEQHIAEANEYIKLIQGN